MRPDQIVTHHFTVDVEEHFQVSAFERFVPRSEWEHHESRVVENTMRLLRMLAASDQHGTFFILGWVAERAPELVKAIADAGHEIASHGWDHRRVTQETPEQFRSSVRRSKQLLEALTGVRVLGYRAPSFSIVQGREWALDILIEEGYEYDSSLFPIRRPGYGYASAHRDPYVLNRPAGRLAEFPPATVRRFGLTLPAAGGAYLRLLPLQLIRSAVLESEARGVPATLYIHPWEVDPDQPRIAVPAATRVRHYGGLRRTEGRLRRLFDEFSFGPIARTLPSLVGMGSATGAVR